MPLPAHTARIPYKTINGHEIHLEAWLPETASAPVPVLAWIHGGGRPLQPPSSPNLQPTNIPPILLEQASSTEQQEIVVNQTCSPL